MVVVFDLHHRSPPRTHHAKRETDRATHTQAHERQATERERGESGSGRQGESDDDMDGVINASPGGVLNASSNVTNALLTEGVSAGVLGDGEGAVGGGFPHVLVVVVVLGDHLPYHHKGPRKKTAIKCGQLCSLPRFFLRFQQSVSRSVLVTPKGVWYTTALAQNTCRNDTKWTTNSSCT